ncbi:MAG: hypothetical protein KF752_10100 [Pirellulaceae bacterium]|nr:hypothetical protein [Pirellulaceae bacterium]
MQSNDCQTHNTATVKGESSRRNYGCQLTELGSGNRRQGMACFRRAIPLLLLLMFGAHGVAQTSEVDGGRVGYVVRVPLPLVGNRDAEVIQQIRSVVDSTRQDASERPVLVLQFEPLGGGSTQREDARSDSSGSQFERCLALARYLTDRETAGLRIVAFLPATVEGHAVLPVLACQEIFAVPDIQLGRAAVDQAADATILAAYQDILARGRTNIPESVVQAMLAPNVALRRVSMTDEDGTRVITQEQADQLSQQGRLREIHESVWNGRELAAFTSQQMRNWLWIHPTVDNSLELAAALSVGGSLRTAAQLPRDWQAVSVVLSGKLDHYRINQLIRGVQQAIQQQPVNLLVLLVDDLHADFDQATRLASALVDLRDELHLVSLIRSPLQGPACLIPVACHQVILIGESTLGPSAELSRTVRPDATEFRVLEHLATATGRPLPLLIVLADQHATAYNYVHQTSGRRELFAEQQVIAKRDRDLWLPKTQVAGGQAIQQQLALDYGLVTAVEDTSSNGLARIGLIEEPPQVKPAWLDEWIQRIVAQPWIARLLLVIGMMALMAEIGQPGIGLGGLVAGLCFLGFFWISALNGNVEWLEILLFCGGLFALAIEVFVLPGFGIFGVTGLTMLLVSLVLAGQTFVWPSNSVQLEQFAANLFWVALLAVAGIVGLVFMQRQFESMPMFRWLSLQPTGTDAIEELEQRESLAHFDHLVGQIGLTTTRLNPSGKAQFGDDIVSVMGAGGVIAAGAKVQVLETRGNVIVVEEMP